MFVSSFPQQIFVSGNFTWGTKKPCTPGGGKKRHVQICCVLGIDRNPGMHLEDKIHAV